MATIPEPMHEHTTATAIIRFYEKQSESPRPHLGASEIGKPCDRDLWYGFRWGVTKKFPGRVKRLLNRGKREEDLLLSELRAIDVEIYEVDPETKQQHRFDAIGGHFGGSCDAIGRGFPEAPKSWCVVEFKTHNAKSFAELVKQGVGRAKPEHYAQMQIYMGLAEIERAMYLAVNKDTDDIYSEWIHFDQKVFDALMQRAQKVIDAGEPLERVMDDPTWFQCKFCNHFGLCHENRVAQKNCRTCAYSTPVEGGWHCGLYDRGLPYEEQRLGCRSHLFIPALVPYGEPQDSGDGWVLYKHKANDKLFANVAEDCEAPPEGASLFTSAELAVASSSIVGDSMVDQIKTEFPGARVVA